MDDPELEAIRQKRLAELSAQGSSGIPSSVLSQLGGKTGGQSGGRPDGGDDEAKAEQESEMRRTMVSQILDNDARERLARIALVRPQRARAIEELLIRMAKAGQMRGRVTEDQLIGVLDQVEAAEAQGGSAPTAPSRKITFSRKDAFDDDFDL